MVSIKKAIIPIVFCTVLGVGGLLLIDSSQPALAQNPTEPPKALHQELELIQREIKRVHNEAQFAEIKSAQLKAEYQSLQERYQLLEMKIENRIQISVSNSEEGYAYSEHLGGETRVYATVPKAEYLSLILKRALQDPQAPKRLSIVAGQQGDYPTLCDMLPTVELVEVLRKLGVKQAYIQGPIYQGRFLQVIRKEANGAPYNITTTTNSLDGKKPIELANLFTDDYIQAVRASSTPEARRRSMEDYKALVSFTTPGPNALGRMQLKLDPKANLKVEDILPVYRLSPKPSEWTRIGSVRVVEVDGGSAWANEEHLLQDQVKIQPTDWLGPPTNRSSTPKK
ncbi:MAG: hypothetical protein ACRC8S_11535 [Fimbriiglobus sp.]